MKSMSKKLENLLNKWPTRIRLIENSTQHCLRFNTTIESSKDVLVISVANISDEERIALTIDYLTTMKILGPTALISHQIDPHVLFLIKNNCVDYRGLELGENRFFSVKPYRLANNLKLEGLIEMSQPEYQKLIRYSELASNKVESVLGPPPNLSKTDPTKYDFTIKDYHTVGQLDDNRFLSEQSRHSCLSWFTMAPIGEEKKRVVDLLNLQSEDFEVSTPEYGFEFAKFFLSNSTNKRLSLLILQSKDPLEEAISKCFNPTYLDSLISLAPDP
jgi:hypothetical protein